MSQPIDDRIGFWGSIKTSFCNATPLGKCAQVGISAWLVYIIQGDLREFFTGYRTSSQKEQSSWLKRSVQLATSPLVTWAGMDIFKRIGNDWLRAK
jgi:hypothetical protein